MQARSAVGGLWWRFSLVLLLSIKLSLGLRVPRVDHPDEIWTLDVIQRSYGEIITFILGNDNHPPLYYLVIKAWSTIAGDGIGSVRLLSFLFGLLTLLLFALFRHRCRPIAFVAPLLLLATNPLFTYYSATIRPYAFLVFLAALATLSSMALRSERPGCHELQSAEDNPRRRAALQILFYGSCLLLGLTHYYGLLYAMILMVWEFWERRISVSRRPAIIVAALLFIWPLTQVLFGSLNEQIKANDWVNVVPVVSTLNNFLMGLFPSLVVSRQPPFLFSLGLMLCLGSLFLAQKSTLQQFGWNRMGEFLQNDVTYLLSSLIIIFAASMAIDLRVPFSTPYYFLVGLPAMALLFGFWLRWLRGRLGLLPASVLIATVALTQSALTQLRLLAP
jgi:uncharacterized membrane protein